MRRTTLRAPIFLGRAPSRTLRSPPKSPASHLAALFSLLVATNLTRGMLLLVFRLGETSPSSVSDSVTSISGQGFPFSGHSGPTGVAMGPYLPSPAGRNFCGRGYNDMHCSICRLLYTAGHTSKWVRLSWLLTITNNGTACTCCRQAS